MIPQQERHSDVLEILEPMDKRLTVRARYPWVIESIKIWKLIFPEKTIAYSVKHQAIVVLGGGE